MACEVQNKEVNSQCAELLVRPLYYLFIDETATASNTYNLYPMKNGFYLV